MNTKLRCGFVFAIDSSLFDFNLCLTGIYKDCGFFTLCANTSFINIGRLINYKKGDIMDEEEWEVIPHKILADLRDEVHILKEKISQPSTRKDMVEAMTELKQSIDNMHSIFKVALESTEKDNNKEIMSKLSLIEKQNEQLAQALVSIADIVENKKEMTDFRIPPSMTPPPMQAMKPPMPPPRMPRAPMMSSPMSSSQLPPPPPAPSRKSFLGKLIR